MIDNQTVLIRYKSTFNFSSKDYFTIHIFWVNRPVLPEI